MLNRTCSVCRDILALFLRRIMNHNIVIINRKKRGYRIYFLGNSSQMGSPDSSTSFLGITNGMILYHGNLSQMSSRFTEHFNMEDIYELSRSPDSHYSPSDYFSSSSDTLSSSQYNEDEHTQGNTNINTTRILMHSNSFTSTLSSDDGSSQTTKPAITFKFKRFLSSIRRQKRDSSCQGNSK
ncbi:hypothetical protein BDB01DRAFT_836191 [Pilobolus umbonatus]|nr:hypothetical protein BDB01DRAFT_836191 [Pilobolus umbonatus]